MGEGEDKVVTVPGDHAVVALFNGRGLSMTGVDQLVLQGGDGLDSLLLKGLQASVESFLQVKAYCVVTAPQERASSNQTGWSLHLKNGPHQTKLCGHCTSRTGLIKPNHCQVICMENTRQILPQLERSRGETAS